MARIFMSDFGLGIDEDLAEIIDKYKAAIKDAKMESAFKTPELYSPNEIFNISELVRKYTEDFSRLLRELELKELENPTPSETRLSKIGDMRARAAAYLTWLGKGVRTLLTSIKSKARAQYERLFTELFRRFKLRDLFWRSISPEYNRVYKELGPGLTHSYGFFSGAFDPYERIELQIAKLFDRKTADAMAKKIEENKNLWDRIAARVTRPFRRYQTDALYREYKEGLTEELQRIANGPLVRTSERLESFISRPGRSKSGSSGSKLGPRSLGATEAQASMVDSVMEKIDRAIETLPPSEAIAVYDVGQYLIDSADFVMDGKMSENEFFDEVAKADSEVDAIVAFAGSQMQGAFKAVIAVAAMAGVWGLAYYLVKSRE